LFHPRSSQFSWRAAAIPINMGIFILMGACSYSVSLATIATFNTWLVCKIRKKATKPNYAGVFFGVLIGVFFAFLALVAITDGAHPRL
jgi:hypothetical protein